MNAVEYLKIVADLAAAGYGGDFDWSENISPPKDADDFFREYCFVVCNSGMKNTVATRIFHKVIRALYCGASASTVFGHKGKTAAMDKVFASKQELFEAFQTTCDPKTEWLGRLPWIGDITKYHLAKNFGVDCAKPDRHLQRLAEHYSTTPEALCKALAVETGHRAATVDVVLWRACAIGMIDTGQMTHPTQRRIEGL